MTSTRTPETEIVADPEVPLIRITREFDATPEQVFRAHTEPELFARWIGPHGYTTAIDTFDCRSGGEFRFVQNDGDADYGFHGCFHEVRPAEVIVQTFTYEGDPDNVALERLTLEALPGGRTRLVATSLVDSFAGRDAWLASGMEIGVNQGYERLDALLA